MKRTDQLNGCRRLLEMTFNGAGIEMPNPGIKNHMPAEKIGALRHLCESAIKFTLPENGVLFEDEKLRAIDENMPLRLPYQKIALEMRVNDGDISATWIVFAWEASNNNIAIFSVALDAPVKGKYTASPVIQIPKTNYIERGKSGEVILTTIMKNSESWPKAEAWCLLDMLNALQCSNVHIKKEPARKPCKKTKNALPFDDYHTLVIETKRPQQGEGHGTLAGERRAMREHLRRGHIVRPEGRRPYWRNATVVNAGKTESKIGKDYAVRAAA